MDPMFIMREGEERVEVEVRRGVRSWVRRKTRERLRVRTRSNADCGYSEYGAPQLLPLLFTRTSRSAKCQPSIPLQIIHSSLLWKMVYARFSLLPSSSANFRTSSSL